MLVNACASALGANAKSDQGRWLTTIPDPTEDEGAPAESGCREEIAWDEL